MSFINDFLTPAASADLYKWSHFEQFKPGMKYISLYIEARGVEAGRDWKEIVVAGTAYLAKELLSKPLITQKSLDRMAKQIPKTGVPFNYEGWKLMLDRYNGFPPVNIQALEEGTVVPIGTPILQIQNTDPDFYWLPSWMETFILRAIWYPTTVATQSYHIKKLCAKYMDETAGHRNGLEFMLNDFGSRGVSSSESGSIGGLAHLYSFMGTDNFEAVELANYLYNEDCAGFSIRASEHGISSSYGGPDVFELDFFKRMIDIYSKPDTTFAVISDTYNLWGALEHKFGVMLKDKIIALGQINSRMVVRPDSGDARVVPVKAIQILMDKFGYTINEKGYKVLPNYIRVIQGDGINENSIRDILQSLKELNISAENIVFGMGGQMLQAVNRDTLKFAMKTSAAINENFGSDWYDVFKDPIDDKGKTSKKGRQVVLKKEGKYVVERESESNMLDDELYLLYAFDLDLEMPYVVDFFDNHQSELTTLGHIRQRINANL